MKYVIKNNLPEEESDLLLKRYGSLSDMYTATARNMFMKVLEYFRNRPGIKIIFVWYRDEKRKPLRGSIQVEIDGFYYYVELFKMK